MHRTATQNIYIKFSHLSHSFVILGISLRTSFLYVKIKILQCPMGCPSTFHLQIPPLSLLLGSVCLTGASALSSVVKP